MGNLEIYQYFPQLTKNHTVYQRVQKVDKHNFIKTPLFLALATSRADCVIGAKELYDWYQQG